MNKSSDKVNITVAEARALRKQVNRLIKNKIEPLTYKHYILKSGNFHNNFELVQTSSSQSPLSMDRGLPRIKLKKLEVNKQNKNTTSALKCSRNKRRKGLVQIANTEFGKQHYKELQHKVQNHIMLKRISIMEDKYTYMEECSKEVQQNMCKQLWTSPLEKYLGLFEKSEKPSQKIKRVQKANCQKILKQIKSAKSIKHIECIQENVKGLWNQDKRPHKSKKIISEPGDQSLKACKQNNKKLKQEILTDIRREYQNQGSSKIRISINHKKMIQIS